MQSKVTTPTSNENTGTLSSISSASPATTTVTSTSTGSTTTATSTTSPTKTSTRTTPTTTVEQNSCQTQRSAFQWLRDGFTCPNNAEWKYPTEDPCSGEYYQCKNCKATLEVNFQLIYTIQIYYRRNKSHNVIILLVFECLIEQECPGNQVFKNEAQNCCPCNKVPECEEDCNLNLLLEEFAAC